MPEARGNEATVRKPRLCVDGDCTPLYWLVGEDEFFEKGGSFECVGRRKEPFTYRFREVTHTNDLNHCIFCPRGIYNFKINLGDLQRTMMQTAHLLRMLDPDFDWEKCRNYYSGEDPNFDRWLKFINEACESKVSPGPEGGAVTCKHTALGCSWNKCPAWKMDEKLTR